MKTKVTINGVEYSLDLEKAKELGVLKAEGCKSWENFCDKYETKQGFHYNDTIEKVVIVDYPCNINEQLTENEAIAIDAFSKLLKLRRDWIGDWEPDWANGSVRKYYIEVRNNEFHIDYHYVYSRTFSFPTKEMAEEFLNCFRDLFEQCKMLI